MRVLFVTQPIVSQRGVASACASAVHQDPKVKVTARMNRPGRPFVFFPPPFFGHAWSDPNAGPPGSKVNHSLYKKHCIMF